ncbi:MAG TPA: hypothetical protein PLJ12_02960 [Planctomycetota bacterium]|nr:hypothetical protein [Planctomycetota bacterium]
MAIAPLAEYTPFGPSGTIHEPFWKKHLPDSAGAFQFEIAFDGPVDSGGAYVWYQLGGTAQLGVHYASSTPNPLVVAPGATSATISLQLLPTGEFFHERFVSLELTQAVGATLDPKAYLAELWIRPSVDPPTLQFGSTNVSVAPGSVAMLPVTLSRVSQEPVSLHYKIDPASTPGDFTVPDSGTVLFAPGQTSAQLAVPCSASATSGSNLTLHLQHERNGVRYVVPALDPMLTSNPDLYPQTIHTDENMWTHSVGGIRAFEYDDLYNPPPAGWAMPGNLTDHVTGGSFWEAGKEDQLLINLLDQSNPNPIVDPFSGMPLKMYTISEAASIVVPYLRKSFKSSFCGGNTQLFSLPEYARISYYIALPEGPDADRAVPFLRIGMRMRSNDINHGITFRIGSTGVDSDGNPVPVVNTSLGPIGVWQTVQTETATDKFGVVEDEYGVRFWYAHRLDPNQPWIHPGTLDVFYETPGVTAGNPIEYPNWLSTGDGSLASLGLSSIDEATGMGNLPYGFFWEISDDDSIFGDNLRPYFPKPRSWWEPQGNAVLDQSTTLTISVP